MGFVKLHTIETSGLSSNTMRRHHDLLSSALRSAVRQDVIPASRYQEALDLAASRQCGKVFVSMDL